jgi:predicted Zn-dependent protease
MSPRLDGQSTTLSERGLTPPYAPRRAAIGDVPRSLFDPALTPADRFLSEADCRALAERAMGFAQGGGETDVGIDSGWLGFLRWGRNRATLAGDRRTNEITVVRTIRGAQARVTTNQVDDISLEAAVRAAERRLLLEPEQTVVWHRPDPRPQFEYLEPKIWSEATYGLTTAMRAEAARALIDPSEAQGMISAGYLAVEARSRAHLSSTGLALYAPATQAQCSMTVRNPKGTGSGWAGSSSYDWGRIDAEALAARALEKCLASQHPVALEPGRYTVILEPQAVADLMSLVVGALSRRSAESGQGPFADPNRRGASKLGQLVADRRVTLGQAPMRPDLGVVPFTLDTGEPVRAVNWIEEGILTHLFYNRKYALEKLHQNLGYPNSGAFFLSGGESSVEEMIQTTKRGLLVTRFSNVEILDRYSLLSTGLTRDGFWLVENGKITKAVKNFRFTESPMFVLNSLEALGTPVPVFRPWYPAVIPPLKARDFGFTSTIDAI